MPMFDTPAESSPVNLDFEGHEEGAGQEQQQAEEQQQEMQNQSLEGQQTEETPAQEETPPQEDTGELILGKYKSVDELINAHEHLQKRLGEMRNELGNLRKQQPQFLQQAQQMVQQVAHEQGWTDAQWQQFNERFYEDFNRDPGRTIVQLAQDIAQQIIAKELTPLKAQIELQQQERTRSYALQSELDFMQSAKDQEGKPLFPDVDKLRPEIEAVLKENPGLADIVVQQAGARAMGRADGFGVLELLYKTVMADTLMKYGTKAYFNGLQAGAKQAQAKTTVALPGQSAKQQQTELSPEEEILNGIFAHRKGGLFI